MEQVVVDTSLAIKWLFVEEQSEVAVLLLSYWLKEDVDILVPSWFMCEFANVVYRRLQKNLFTLEEVQIRLREVMRFVRVTDFEPAVSVRSLEIARDLGWHASYDPHYLAMAEYLDCECWTADFALWQAATVRFPRIKWIGQVVETASSSAS